ncbi:hypothetical protein [Shouchella shacheensis]|uniref:hypothetical protein n=1 Tax=Shouchella shacheensis TaxID=1649580 RepID=UPI00073FB83B|nr:hypothetical protein [Shouchella shacheensis]
MKTHRAFVFILFAIGGVLLTGLAGILFRYIIALVWPDGFIAGFSIWGSFFVTALPGLVGSLYWAYFFIKKERHETKHLDDPQRSDKTS